MIQLDIATNINLTRSIAVIFGVAFMDLSWGIELRNSTVDGQHGIAHVRKLGSAKKRKLPGFQ
jgi:hypothetical protein